MRGSLTTLVLFAIIGGLLLLLLHQNVGGGEPLSNGDIASLIAKIGFLILISGAVLRLLRDRFSDALRQAMIWVIFGLALVVVYTFRFELRDTGDRVLAELIPGHAPRTAKSSRSLADAAATSRSPPRSTAYACRWCSTPARARWC